MWGVICCTAAAAAAAPVSGCPVSVHGLSMAMVVGSILNVRSGMRNVVLLLVVIVRLLRVLRRLRLMVMTMMGIGPALRHRSRWVICNVARRCCYYCWRRRWRTMLLRMLVMMRARLAHWMLPLILCCRSGRRLLSVMTLISQRVLTDYLGL